jgi:SAM-dependent methyltransferase
MEEVVATEAASMLDRWLVEHEDLFPQTDARDVVVPWLTYRVVSTFLRGGTQVDLGGGLSLANAVLAQLGMSAYVVDLLEGYFPHSSLQTDGTAQVAFLESQGVKFIRADLTNCNLLDHFDPDSVDVFSSYHALEHMHHSPRRMLESAMEAMKPGGRVFFEVPNAANLLKRLRLLIGRTNYPEYEGFWEPDIYFGHVREYSVADLKSLAGYLRLRNVKIVGKNWFGALYRKIPNRALAQRLDGMLQPFPGLCGSLFLSGMKEQRNSVAA